MHLDQQLGLQNVFAFLVLLGVLKRPLILPTHEMPTLSAVYVPYDVPSRGHISLCGIAGVDVDDVFEEEGFAVLASEVLCETITSVYNQI